MTEPASGVTIGFGEILLIGTVVGVLVTLLTAETMFKTRWKTKVVDVIEEQVMHGELISKPEFQQFVNTVDLRLQEIRQEMRSIEVLERRQVELSSVLEVGIRDRLDGMMSQQQLVNQKVDELSSTVNRIVGMMER